MEAAGDSVAAAVAKRRRWLAHQSIGFAVISRFGRELVNHSSAGLYIIICATKHAIDPTRQRAGQSAPLD